MEWGNESGVVEERRLGKGIRKKNLFCVERSTADDVVEELTADAATAHHQQGDALRLHLSLSLSLRQS